MSQGYQARDAAIVDYQLWQPAPDGRWLRGPRPDQLVPGSYFACVGAAQTFGCFVARPWPSLLQQQLGLPALNLGIAGAGPALFRNDALLQLLRGARFVVYQVMSGRSADCSRFATGGHERVTLPDGRQLGAGAAWSELLQQDLHGIKNPVLRGIKNRLCATFGRKHIRRLVAETQSNWSSDFRALIKDVARPSALLWFSKRTPQHRARYHSLEALFGEFPQLIDATMVRSPPKPTTTSNASRRAAARSRWRCRCGRPTPAPARPQICCGATTPTTHHPRCTKTQQRPSWAL